MASKDNKTSKTARVMNLLSKKADPAAEEPAVEAGQPAAEASSAPVPPIVSSLAPDAAVSTQIKNALEDAREGELEARQPAPAPVADEPAAPAQPEPVQVAAPQPVDEPAPAPVMEEPATVWTVPLKPINPGYINVMQVLVEEKAPKYVQMFGLCTCERCMEDVKALTLNSLPSKYVVLEQGDLVPRLTVYENKFSSDITAQMLKACRLVMERPHHNR